VNWDPHFQTAISDLEVEAREVDGHYWHFAYPLRTARLRVSDRLGPTDGKTRNYIVATTRPETMLGDTAVAVHPSDERYAGLCRQGGPLPIAESPDPDHRRRIRRPGKGSGAVKITPAHDFNDFQVGKRHNLPSINILDDFGPHQRQRAARSTAASTASRRARR
jgi:valyl-tRNA synthetase